MLVMREILDQVWPGAILGFFYGVAQGGPRSSQGGPMGKVIMFIAR